jgi:hypothetical protein
MNNNKGCCCTAKLSVCNLGVSIGLVNGLAYAVLAFILMYYEDVGRPVMHMMSSLYNGYEATAAGAFAGFIWGFVTGYVYGALIALFYNFCYCRCPCKYCKTNRSCKCK